MCESDTCSGGRSYVSFSAFLPRLPQRGFCVPQACFHQAEAENAAMFRNGGLPMEEEGGDARNSFRARATPEGLTVGRKLRRNPRLFPFDQRSRIDGGVRHTWHALQASTCLEKSALKSA